jgi:hypothetical protein
MSILSLLSRPSSLFLPVCLGFVLIGSCSGQGLPVPAGARKMMQFSGNCPAPARTSSSITYNFDLKKEHFWLCVPPGYTGQEPWGLIVYTNSADRQVAVPPGWDKVLADDKLLFIATEEAGNNKLSNRREGLAVIAALEMMKTYSIDPNRVYAAGMSGGARIASDLGFQQPDIFHATIQCCGTDFPKPVPRVAVTDDDLKHHGESYGLLDGDLSEVNAAKANVKFVMTTGDGDFRHNFILDIYNGGFKADGYQALLLDVPGMKHQPCRGDTLQQALDFIEKDQTPL